MTDISSLRVAGDTATFEYDWVMYVVDSVARSRLGDCCTNIYIGMRLKMKSTMTFSSNNLLLSVKDETDGPSFAEQFTRLTASYVDAPISMDGNDY